MNELLTALPEELFALLQKEAFVLLGTIDSETNGPVVNAISWIYAVDRGRLRFAVDHRSRLINNMKQQSQVTVTCFGAGSVHTIYGKASMVIEALSEVPFQLSCFDIAIDIVRDAMFYGARISTAPEYEKTYDKRAAEKLDGQVFSSMKKA
ncbi:MAG: pyridoxamine 5'-phosphate oxidase family protein [Paenibacillaceae bacterium]